VREKAHGQALLRMTPQYFVSIVGFRFTETSKGRAIKDLCSCKLWILENFRFQAVENESRKLDAGTPSA